MHESPLFPLPYIITACFGPSASSFTNPRTRYVFSILKSVNGENFSEPEFGAPCTHRTLIPGYFFIPVAALRTTVSGSTWSGLT